MSANLQTPGLCAVARECIRMHSTITCSFVRNYAIHVSYFVYFHCTDQPRQWIASFAGKATRTTTTTTTTNERKPHHHFSSQPIYGGKRQQSYYSCMQIVKCCVMISEHDDASFQFRDVHFNNDVKVRTFDDSRCSMGDRMCLSLGCFAISRSLIFAQRFSANRLWLNNVIWIAIRMPVLRQMPTHRSRRVENDYAYGNWPEVESASTCNCDACIPS